LRYRWPVSWESVWNVLRWVLAALVAGFIGQFGKSFALRLIERRRRERALHPQDAVSKPAASDEGNRLEALVKIEKKRAKAEAKRAKKSKAPEGESND
jgi:hypothetical protein